MENEPEQGTECCQIQIFANLNLKRNADCNLVFDTKILDFFNSSVSFSIQNVTSQNSKIEQFKNLEIYPKPSY